MITKPLVRRQALPESLLKSIETTLARLDHPVDRPERLAAAVLKLSNHYIENPLAPTPWSEAWVQAAYVGYYLPLNYARVRAVSDEGRLRGFFDGLESVVDFGTGLGTALFALEDAGALQTPRVIAIDAHDNPLRLQSELAHHRSWSSEKSSRFNERDHRTLLPNGSKRLAVFSYTLTELSHLPSWAYESEALMLIEPSTREDGRKLLSLRAQLIDEGYFAWAPCTHQSGCPLYINSERDWCHDRIEWSGPEWWEQLEKGLPMKNRTLTFSYLLMRKTSPPPPAKSLSRIVGDTLEEKGKTRQLICRGPQREFLAWFPQRMKKDHLEIPRGALVHLREGLQEKSNEVRVGASTDLTFE